MNKSTLLGLVLFVLGLVIMCLQYFFPGAVSQGIDGLIAQYATAGMAGLEAIFKGMLYTYYVAGFGSFLVGLILFIVGLCIPRSAEDY